MALMDRHPITPPPAAAPPHPAPAKPIRQPRLEAIEGGAAARPRPAAPFSLKRWLESGIGGAVLGCLSIATVLLAWYLATRYKVEFYVRFGNIPTPADVWRSILDVTHTTKYAVNIGISVRRVLIGFCGAAVVGTVLGVMVGRYRIFRSLALPAMELFRPIPAIAWVPMAIMLWPNNEVSISFITFLGAFFPILLNTVHGVESVDGVLLRAAHSLGAKEKDVILYVVIPGALPHIFTGLAVGMGVAWVSLIAAEMISGQFGIGYFTWEAYSLISYPDIALGMITIGVLGLLCSKAIDLCSKLAMPWMALVAGAAK